MIDVLIIGSKGFIGKHCVQFLSEKGHRVFECDVVVDYNNENYYLIDASNSDFSKIFAAKHFDVCINCSGAASVPDSIKNPLRDFNLNTVNVFKILNSIKEHNPECKFINLSSAAVYGNPEKLPISEGSAASPVSPYGFHKWQSELVCKEMSQLFNLKTCGLRIFSAYGEGLKKQLFWDLHKKAQKTDLISLFGSGEESRDFIYIADLVEAVYLVVQNARFEGEVINIANGKNIRISKAVEPFYSHYPTQVKFEFSKVKREGDPDDWCADISVLKAFGYKQRFSLNTGLQNYVKWLGRID